MRSLILLGALLVLPTLVTAEETKKPQLQFQGQTFELALSQANQVEAINEYIPPGETLEKWNTLIAVRSYADRRDYEQLAGGLKDGLAAKVSFSQASRAD